MLCLSASVLPRSIYAPEKQPKPAPVMSISLSSPQTNSYFDSQLSCECVEDASLTCVFEATHFGTILGFGREMKGSLPVGGGILQLANPNVCSVNLCQRNNLDKLKHPVSIMDISRFPF